MALGVSAMGGAAVAVYFSRSGEKEEDAKRGKDGKAKGALATASSMTSIAVEDADGRVDKSVVRFASSMSSVQPGGRLGPSGTQHHHSLLYLPPDLEIV